MRKIIFSMAVVLSAVAMVACGGKNTLVKKGGKSNVDSLSYAIGVDVGMGITTNMPDLKFDWATLTKSAEKALYTEVKKGEEDKKQVEGTEILQEFFNNTRRDRVTAYVETLNIPDSLMGVEPIDFSGFDSFESDAERKQVSEAYGYDLGCRLRDSRLPLHLYWLNKGIEEGAAGTSSIDAHGAMMVIQEYFTVTLPFRNKRESEAWLAKIEKKSGVKKTESGLLYRIDRKGDESIKPTANDRVKVDYEGKLQDGTVFDSSYERGQSIEFPLSGVIAGWTEGLQLVGKGGQITLWIPSELAYGAHGGGSLIGPNQALEFKVELHDIKSTATPEAVPAE